MLPTNFVDDVLKITRKIPKGRVTSYGAIAKSLGVAKSSRMVGWALKKSGMEIEFVPAHRVLNRNGLLSGKNAFSSETRMQELLEEEGIEVLNDKVVRFSELFWDPISLGEIR